MTIIGHLTKYSHSRNRVELWEVTRETDKSESAQQEIALAYIVQSQ
jgi:hypothetical protein